MILSSSLPATRPHQASAAALPAGDGPAPDPEQPPFARVALEKVCGTVQAFTKVPASFLPCLVAGVAHGVSGGMDEKRLARLLDIASGVQVAVGLTLALGTQGNMLQTFLTKGVLGGLGAYIVSRGGTNLKLAQDLAAHKPEGSLLERAFQGASHGVRTAVVDGIAVGYSEGRGDAAGLWEGGQMLPAVLKEGENPQGWGARLAGGATGALLVPGAVVDGLSMALGQGKLASPWLLGASSVAVAACVGALVLGAPAAAVGAGVALLASLKGAKSAHERVEASVEKLNQAGQDLGDPVANKHREFVGAMVVGGAAGARAGYQAWS